MAKRLAQKKALKNFNRDVESNASGSDDLDEDTSASRSSSGSTSIDYKQILREIYTNPTVRYMAGGVAAAILNRFANRVSDKYPEIGSFLRENIGTFESKLSEFKSSMNDGAQARH